jgi:hypothetical protein
LNAYRYGPGVGWSAIELPPFPNCAYDLPVALDDCGNALIAPLRRRNLSDLTFEDELWSAFQPPAQAWSDGILIAGNDTAMAAHVAMRNGHAAIAWGNPLRVAHAFDGSTWRTDVVSECGSQHPSIQVTQAGDMLVGGCGGPMYRYVAGGTWLQPEQLGIGWAPEFAMNESGVAVAAGVVAGTAGAPSSLWVTGLE